MALAFSVRAWSKVASQFDAEEALGGGDLFLEGLHFLEEEALFAGEFLDLGARADFAHFAAEGGALAEAVAHEFLGVVAAVQVVGEVAEEGVEGLALGVGGFPIGRLAPMGGSGRMGVIGSVEVTGGRRS